MTDRHSIDMRAYDIPGFCRAYSISRSQTYREIKARRLRICKIGRATRIARQDAESWLAARQQDPHEAES